jgi:hypothetical protein
MMNLPLGVAPEKIVADTPFVFFEHKALQPHPLDDRGLQRAEMQIRPISAQPLERAHRSMVAAMVHNCVRIRRVEARIAGYNYQIAGIKKSSRPRDRSATSNDLRAQEQHSVRHCEEP